MNRDYELWRAQGYCASLRPLHWPGHVDAWIADVVPLSVTPLFDDPPDDGPRPAELTEWEAEFDAWVTR